MTRKEKRDRKNGIKKENILVVVAVFSSECMGRGKESSRRSEGHDLIEASARNGQVPTACASI